MVDCWVTFLGRETPAFWEWDSTINYLTDPWLAKVSRHRLAHISSRDESNWCALLPAHWHVIPRNHAPVHAKVLTGIYLGFDSPSPRLHFPQHLKTEEEIKRGETFELVLVPDHLNDIMHKVCYGTFAQWYPSFNSLDLLGFEFLL